MKTTDPRFEPPFCPRPECRFHRDPTGWDYARDGYHYNQALRRRIRRWRCRNCGRRFCSQTFDTTYWLKKPEVQEKIFRASNACSAYRQIGEQLGVAHSTVQRHLERLGRHCLLYHERHRPRELPDEPLVLDGFVSFEYSQYWPFHLNLLVGADSHFLHAFTDAEVRRTGRMTAAQKARRAELEERWGRPDPRTVVNEVEQVIRLVAPKPARLNIRSDEHPAYPLAFARLTDEGYEIEHEKTSGKKARTTGNQLFPVNLIDLIIRHCGAHHKRETIAFSKRRANAAVRLAVLQVWRNYMRPFSVKKAKGKSPCPAERLGLRKGLLEMRELLLRRLFPTLVGLPRRLQPYYWHAVETRQLPEGRRHVLKYAF